MYACRGGSRGGSGGSIEPPNFSPIKIFRFSIFLCAGRARPVAGLASALCTVDHIDQCLKLARNTAFWSQNCGSASPIMSKRLPKRRAPDQLPLDFGAARRARPACARSENAAAAISPAKKADQSEIPAPSTPPAGQPEIHGAEECQLQEGEQDSICDTSSELAHRSHVGTSSESESGLGFEDIGKLLGSGPLNLSASEKMKLIEEYFVPSESFAFPKVQMNLHNRSFHHGG